MTVNSKERAWELVNQYFPTDYIKDERSSRNAGYDVYRSTLDDSVTEKYQPWYCTICDLGCRIEIIITYADWYQDVIYIWIDEEKLSERPVKTEEELKKIAEKIADRVCVYVTHHDEIGYEVSRTEITRRASAIERDIIYKIAFGALESLNGCSDVRSDKSIEQAICDTAEFMLMHFLPDVNTYVTLYTPLKNTLENWRHGL